MPLHLSEFLSENKRLTRTKIQKFINMYNSRIHGKLSNSPRWLSHHLKYHFQLKTKDVGEGRKPVMGGNQEKHGKENKI